MDETQRQDLRQKFPDNSHKNKSKPEKRVEKIVVGKVTKRKRPLKVRLREAFLGDDATTVGTYILQEVIVPAAKNMLADAASQGAERMLFGDSRGRSKVSGRPSYTSYSSYSRQDRDRPRELSRKARAIHKFDEIILTDRGEAEEVLDRLVDLTHTYETASVADLYDLIGITSDYTDDQWGWSDLRLAQVARVRGGYLIDLPRPVPID